MSIIEARGRRDPELAARMRGEAPMPVPVEYYVGRKALKVGEEWRQPGDPIPEAADWPRVESWLRSGAIEARPITADSEPQHRRREAQRSQDRLAEERAVEREQEDPPSRERPARRTVAKKATRPRPAPRRVHADDDEPTPQLRPLRGRK